MKALRGAMGIGCMRGAAWHIHERAPTPLGKPGALWAPGYLGALLTEGDKDGTE